MSVKTKETVNSTLSNLITETDYVNPSYFTNTTHFEGQLVYRIS